MFIDSLPVLCNSITNIFKGDILCQNVNYSRLNLYLRASRNKIADQISNAILDAILEQIQKPTLLLKQLFTLVQFMFSMKFQPMLDINRVVRDTIAG